MEHRNNTNLPGNPDSSHDDYYEEPSSPDLVSEMSYQETLSQTQVSPVSSEVSKDIFSKTSQSKHISSEIPLLIERSTQTEIPVYVHTNRSEPTAHLNHNYPNQYASPTSLIHPMHFEADWLSHNLLLQVNTLIGILDFFNNYVRSVRRRPHASHSHRKRRFSRR